MNTDSPAIDLNHRDGPEYSAMLLPAVWYTDPGRRILPSIRHTRPQAEAWPVAPRVLTGERG
jgi:hypothetical protein